MIKFAALGAMLGFAALALAACAGGVSQEDHDALARETAVAAAAAQRAQVFAALEPLDPLRYHEAGRADPQRGARADGGDRLGGARPRELALGGLAERSGGARRAVRRVARLAAGGAASRRRGGGRREPSRIVHALAHTFEAALEAWLDGRAAPAPPELAGLEPPSHAHPSASDDGMSMGR